MLSSERNLFMRFLEYRSVLLLLLAVAALSGCEGITVTLVWSGSHSMLCNGNGSSAHCTVSFTPNEDFNWTASSNPTGATFQPSAGSVAAGESSGDIQVTLPPSSSGDAVTLDFTDEAQHLQLEVVACYTFCIDHVGDG
jgi:hypothetical protein